MTTGLANGAAPWVEGWEPASLDVDPLTTLRAPIALAQRPGRPAGIVEQTGDSPRPARADITFYMASPDGSAIRPMSGLHGAIVDRVETAHQGESERPWDAVVTMDRYAPTWGWDAGTQQAADAFGL